MTHLTGAQCASASVENLQSAFLQILPRIQTHAQVRFQFVRCPGKKDDAIAEVIAVCWRWFVRLVEQKKSPEAFVSTLVDFAIRQVRCGRRLCGQEKAKDAMSPSAQRNKGFKIERLPCSTRYSHESLYSSPHAQENLNAFEERLRDNLQTPVPDQVVFRCDFTTWRKSLCHRDRSVADDLMRGERTADVARKHRLTPGRISQLRRELYADWRRFHGEMV